jgi:hypothetical protein
MIWKKNTPSALDTPRLNCVSHNTESLSPFDLGLVFADDARGLPLNFTRANFVQANEQLIRENSQSSAPETALSSKVDILFELPPVYITP